MERIVSWTTKLARHKLRKYHRILSIRSSEKPEEVVMEADLKCIICRNRVADAISSMGVVESMVVHVLEKKVTLKARESVRQG